MLRRCAKRSLMEGIQARPQLVATLPVLAQDISREDFHVKCLPGLYDPVERNSPFSKCEMLFNRRIIVSVPCSVNKKCLRVPMLVDTGAPSTYLHTIAMEKFFDSSQNVPSSFDAYIGNHLVKAQMNTEVDEKRVTAYLNILGMDFLNSAVPELLPWISAQLSKVQPQEMKTEFIVTGADSTFPVTPKHPFVMYLKQAIKENKMYRMDASRIIIKSPDCKVMRDKDPLHAGVKYQFELPAAT